MKNDLRVLRDRAMHVLDSGEYAGEAASTVLQVVQPLGAVALFGGLLRDLVLEPPSSSLNDMDLVVATSSEHLGSQLAKLDATQNRYGGYRIPLGGWTFDVWALDQTWAFKHRLVDGASFANLVQTTFFNWDAIVWELGTWSFHCLPNYFEQITSRLLEINLDVNANPAGNVVRAIRHMKFRSAKWGPKLVRYAFDLISDPSNKRELQKPQYLQYLDDSETTGLQEALRKHIEKDDNSPFQVSSWPRRVPRLA